MPHIQTYYSSQTETLVESLLFQLQNSPTSAVNTPFGRSLILVPNSGMQRYVELGIAQHFGICSHIDIHYVGQLLSHAYKAVLDNESPAHVDERQLTFALLRLWNKQILPLDSGFSKLHEQHRHPRQRYLWASQITQRLRQYINDRPEMIAEWQQPAGRLTSQHPHEAWQRDSFVQLFQSLSLTQLSRLNWHQRFAEALATQPDVLPDYDAIHVFGFHALPVTQLADLVALATQKPVYFYTFNPCVSYWQDIVSENIKARLDITAEDEAKLMTVGHPLLATWGQSGKYYIEQLNEYPSHNLDDIVGVEVPDSVLGWLQNDIRTLSESADSELLTLAFDKEKQQHGKQTGFAPYSLTLNACANPRREIEVLYDNLCHCFATTDLQPSDVLVIVPKLNDYAPHIQAIFSRALETSSQPDPNIPYSLANQSAAESEPDVQAFLSLLDVLEGDFQAPLLFGALSEVRVQEALKLDPSHLDTLRHWFQESRFSLHFYDNNHGESSSLEKLLDSLLLATVGGEDCELGKRHASPYYHGAQQDVVAQLCELWQRFLPFAGLKNQRLTLPVWHDKLRELADAFLPLNHGMDTWLTTWYDTLIELADEAVYDFATVRADLAVLLQNDRLHGPFLSGGVSFCAVVPMRSIPAKMIAVLGLNGDFPAIATKDPLDLRLDKPLWSDRNPHKEQQYFFLETLMAARQQLYLSHVGLDEKTGESLPPSALVRELFGYLSRYLPDFADTVTRYYPLQGFASQHAYHSLYNTPDKTTETINTAQNTAKANQPAASNETPNVNATTPAQTQPADMPLPESLTASALAAILLQPLAAYWRYRLGAQDLDNLAEPLPAYEFIATDSGLDAWHYRQSVLEQALQPNADDHTGIEALQQRNLYAPEVISTALLAQASDFTRPLIDAIHELQLEDNPTSIRRLNKHVFAGRHLYLNVQSQRYCEAGLLSYHSGKWNAKKQLTMWINHVFYHALADVSPCQSQVLTLEKNSRTKKIYVKHSVLSPFAEHSRAVAVLDNLLALAQRLIQQPYCVELHNSSSKAETLMHYQPAENSLYPQLKAPNAAQLDDLQQQWLAIDSVFRALVVK